MASLLGEWIAPIAADRSRWRADALEGIEEGHSSISMPFYLVLAFWLVIIFAGFGLSAPSAETAAMLFWALLASGQITMRKADGWQSLTQKLAGKPIDLAA
jgi:hypothetical protein